MLDSLEKLKAELIKQKSAIISKGGKVVSAHTNPSPAEITAAINTIAHADLSQSTAKPEDVKLGKTFYSQDETLKVGTHEDKDYGDVTATPADVKINKTFYDKEGNFATGSHRDPELNLATATAEDVKIGKTFFAGDIEIKTGTHTDPDYSSATATDNDVAFGMTYFAGNDQLKTGSYVKPQLDNADAVEMDVAFGKTFYAGNNLIKTGKYVKPDFSGTATEQDVVKGKTFYGADHVKRTGTHLDTDFSISTATEEDVVKGKTFFSQDNKLKTGTHTETDFTLANATEEDVVAGKTFFSQDDQLKTGTHLDTDFTLANASEYDVAAGKTFYSGDKELKTGSYVAPDFSNTTATTDDVAKGKQFYDSNGRLVTGTSIGDSDMFLALVNPALRKVPKQPIYFTYPQGAKSTGNYAFYFVQAPAYITIGSSIEDIDRFSFDSDPDFPITITDYPNLPKMKGVYQAAFRNTKNVSLDEFPPQFYGCQGYAFYNCCKNSTKIKIPSGFSNALEYAFASDKRYELEEFDLSESNMTDMGDHLIHYLAFKKPIIINEGVKIVGAGFNYNGDSPYVEVPSTCKDVYDSAFYGFTSQALSLTQRKYIYFKSVTPPNFQSANIFHKNYLQTDFRIYVPDESVEAYKAVANLSKMVDKIFPISQLAE